MSKSYEVRGLVHSIGETKEFGANGFTKREFVLKLTGDEENPSYPNYIALELIKDKCSVIDEYSIGDEITVQLNISGRLWTPEGQPEKCGTNTPRGRLATARRRQETPIMKSLQSHTQKPWVNQAASIN